MVMPAAIGDADSNVILVCNVSGALTDRLLNGPDMNLALADENGSGTCFVLPENTRMMSGPPSNSFLALRPIRHPARRYLPARRAAYSNHRIAKERPWGRFPTCHVSY